MFWVSLQEFIFTTIYPLSTPFKNESVCKYLQICLLSEVCLKLFLQYKEMFMISIPMLFLWTM